MQFVPLVLVSLLSLSLPVVAQTTKAPPLVGAIASGAINSRGDWPQARSGDVDSIDHILGALYEVISGPAGAPRDWSRFRSLFVPGARLMPVRVVPGTPDPSTSPATDVVYISLDDYVTRNQAATQTQGFFERPIHNETAQFGGIVHVFSTYESRHAAADPQPFSRGINSIQLLHDGGRYWIVDIFWDAERRGLALPAQYLPRLQPSVVVPDAPLANLVGDWVGQLQYRDFQTNARIFLPTWLSVSEAADGRSVTLDYTYDDGPGKTVRSREILVLSAAGVSFTNDRDHSSESYAVAGFDEFHKLNRGTLTFTGRSIENDKPVDVEAIFTLRRNLYTYEKRTRPAGSGEAFEFRDGYTFTRIEPAVVPAGSK